MYCDICANNCFIPEGNKGKCGLYACKGEGIVEKNPNRYLIISPLTIETMPMLHFQPRGKFLQISTVGCNFDCPGCISTVVVKEMDSALIKLKERLPEEIVQEALGQKCLGIAFLMNDPLASWLTFVKVAKQAKAKGLLVGCSSNAYFSETSLEQILPYLDFINVGVKGFSDQVYQECGARSMKPIWKNIQKLYHSGIHLEISCVYRKGEEQELKRFAKKIAGLSADIPLQIMRFLPLEGTDPSQEPSILKAENVCVELRKDLHYVYLFNSPGTEYLNTKCPHCGEWVFQRDFYGPMGARVRDSNVIIEQEMHCATCGQYLPFKGLKTKNKKESFQEGEFQGGYPFTRALEILESIAITMGINDKQRIGKIWNEYTDKSNLDRLHQDVQNPHAFIRIVREIGELVEESEKASELANYLETKLAQIEERGALIEKKPRVYYAMGSPLFGIKGGRMENQLVEAAGGISVNRELKLEGRPGRNIVAVQLNDLNPEYIFISAFISSPIDDFYDQCEKKKITAEAVKTRNIYTHPASGWDFGSPRWILGLMNIANTLHPKIYKFNIAKEANDFYKTFYHMPFVVEDINRSFSKPTSGWKIGTALMQE
ncbi:radical SAM protein [Dehalobacter restrictus]|uniref:Radical SAM protein n=1 Tax=Dehalobacter restrictus TaxID=55583 RepID=A0A857DF37_9FIRM|nr:radical SAM protein [Dehalobacter restrictus]QGZ99247.1 radical SAM protein [Dehalobacter restrictus]